MALAKDKHTSTEINRRSLMTAALTAPIVAVAAAAPVMAVEAETPVKRAYRSWLAYRDYVNNDTSGMDDNDFDVLCDTRRVMEHAIYDLPSQGPADVLLKLLVLNDNGNDFSDDAMETGIRLLAEARALVA